MSQNRLPDYLDHGRNRIAHGYFDINLEVVWDTIQTALPVLKSQLDALPPT